MYQIAETFGVRAEEIRETLTPSELCEWGVYLNSPFSTRGRDVLMNGWLVHVIRSIMADKRHKPKFSDSMFPFVKLAEEFYATAKKPNKPVVSPISKGKPQTVGEVAHMSQVWGKRYEAALADYQAGRKPNRFGLYVNEKVKLGK